MGEITCTSHLAHLNVDGSLVVPLVDNVGIDGSLVFNSDDETLDIYYQGNIIQIGSGGGGGGDITSVTAGSGLTDGGTSGGVTLNVGAGTGITVNADDVAIDQAFSPTWTGFHSFSNSTGVALTPFNTGTGQTTALLFLELAAGGTNYVGFKAPDSITAGNVVWTLPAVDSTGTQALVSNGSGLLSWSSVGSGTITAVVAGAGLTGGGSSGSVTLDIGAGTGITVNANDVAINQSFSPTWLGLHKFANSSGVQLLAYGASPFEQTELRFYDNSNTAYVAFVAAEAVATTTWILPVDDSIGTQYLGSDGSGNLGWYSPTESGDIEEVVAGDGLTGGGVTGSVTLDVGAGTGITVAANSVAVDQAFSPDWTGVHTFASSSGLSLKPYSTSPTRTTELHFMELAANGTNYVGFKAPDAITANKIWTLPATDSTGTQALVSNGSLVLSWADIGDITAVVAGAGLTGGATSGSATLDVGAGTGITVNANDVAVNQAFAPTWTGLHKFVNSNGVQLHPYGPSPFEQTELRFYDNSGTAYVGFRADEAVATRLYIWPASDASGWLKSDGSGNLTWDTTVGDITSVVAGAGLTGGATSGAATLDVGAGTGITVNANDVAINQAATLDWTGRQSFSNALGPAFKPYGTSTGETTELRFFELAATGSEYVGFKAPDSIAASKVWVLPNADGAASTALITNGSLALSWGYPANVTDGDKGDITITSGVWAIESAAVRTIIAASSDGVLQAQIFGG